VVILIEDQVKGSVRLFIFPLQEDDPHIMRIIGRNTVEYAELPKPNPKNEEEIPQPVDNTWHFIPDDE
jgi:hypothetical protein